MCVCERERDRETERERQRETHTERERERERERARESDRQTDREEVWRGQRTPQSVTTQEPFILDFEKGPLTGLGLAGP